jgi:hypothetical protein
MLSILGRQAELNLQYAESLDKCGQFGSVSDCMSVLVSETPLILLDFFGATRRIRTDDLLITNQLLYQLS